VIEFVAVITALFAFYVDLEDRKEERLARMWNLATDPRPGNSGKIPALEYLNKEHKYLVGIEIPKAFLDHINLENAVLQRSNLERADLKGAHLKGATLWGATLKGATLEGAQLEGANLTGANLEDAYLGGAGFKNADLRNAILKNANLERAYLVGANLEGADFNSVRGLVQSQIDTVFPSDKPRNFPEDLRWPFVKTNGEWVINNRLKGSDPLWGSGSGL